jgi:hypothetical protein
MDGATCTTTKRLMEQVKMGKTKLALLQTLMTDLKVGHKLYQSNRS